MSTKKNAGVVTAYGAAVAGGYQGTYEEFCALMADLGVQVGYLENMTVTVQMLDPDQSPTASYADGTLTLGIPRGSTGATGPQGPTGPTGPTGPYFTPSVNSDGDLSWTNNGGLENPATKNIKGPQGEQGPTGYPTDAQVQTAVNAWLGENVDPETGYVLDRTLQQQNAAAPADLVGELKSSTDSLKDRVEDLDGEILASWEVGTLSQNNILTPPCSYNTSTCGIRTKMGTTVHLFPNDKFSLSDYTGLLICAYGRKDSDSSVCTIANVSTDIVIQYEGDYALLVYYSDYSKTASVETLLPLVRLERANSVSKDVEILQETIEPFKDVKLGNLMPDLSEWIDGRVFSGDYSSAITSVKCTDFIPVTGGETYYIYGGFISQEYFGVYDQYKSKITSGWSFTSLTTDGNNKSRAAITLPSSARYIRIDLLKAEISKFPENAYIGTVPNCLPKKIDLTDYVPRLKGNGTLADKKILVVGDSISTDYYGDYKKWVTYLCENGFFSSGFVTNDSYHATGYVATYNEGGSVARDNFLNRVSAMDLSGYDLIVTFGGINDWIQSIDFDDFKDAVDDYYAYLIENATQARIAVLTPLKTFNYGATNIGGKTQKDFADYIKEVANEYSLPVLNLTDESGFCPNKSSTFSNMWSYLPAGSSTHDGVHPNTDWEKKYLTPQIAWFLAGLI